MLLYRWEFLCLCCQLALKSPHTFIYSNLQGLHIHQGGASFVGPFCYLICFMFVFVKLSCAFFAALWSPSGTWQTAWLSYSVWCFIVFLSLSLMVSWVRCGTWLYQFLIFAFYFTLYQTSCEKEVKCSTSLPLYRLFQGRLMNWIRHDHSCKIFYIFTLNEDNVPWGFNSIHQIGLT